MFGEKKTENIKGTECPVWQTPKYELSKQKAIEIIDSDKYGISEGDFWILMNTYANGQKVAYTGLILSHNGCLKINDKLEDGFRAEHLSREWLNGSLIYEYNDGTLYEVGEVSERNCRNDYPYAMAFKRCFDRVVLKKSKLAFSNIYSEVEADEFKEPITETDPSDLAKEFDSLYTDDEKRRIFDNYKINDATELQGDVLAKYVNFKKYGKKHTDQS